MKSKLEDAENVQTWTVEKIQKQIELRHELIDQCCGSLYPAIYSAQIRELQTELKKRQTNA